MPSWQNILAILIPWGVRSLLFIFLFTAKRGHFRRPELPFPMMVIIIFLLISLVFRNVRK